MAVNSVFLPKKPLPPPGHFLLDSTGKDEYTDQILEQIERVFERSSAFTQRDVNGVTIGEKVIRLSRSNSNGTKIWEMAIVKIFKTKNLEALEHLLEKRPVPRLRGVPFYALAIATNWVEGFHAMYKYRFNLLVKFQINEDFSRLLGLFSVTLPITTDEGPLLSLCTAKTDPMILHVLLQAGSNPNAKIFGATQSCIWELFATDELKDRLMLFQHYGAEIDLAKVPISVQPYIQEIKNQLHNAHTIPNSERKTDRESLALVNGKVLTPLSHSVTLNDFNAFRKLMSVNVSLNPVPPLFCHWTPQTDPRITRAMLEASIGPNVLIVNMEPYYPTPYASYGIALECDLELIEPLAANLLRNKPPIDGLTILQMLDPVNNPVVEQRLRIFISYLETQPQTEHTAYRIGLFTRLIIGKSERHNQLMDLIKRGVGTTSADAEN